MKDSQQSGLRIFSLGLVANNKLMSEKTIQVTPIESLTMLDGELGSIPTEVETQGTDATGQSYNTKVKTDTAIEATWLPLGTNRLTAPDVRRGERVLIWQFGDTDQYYWTSLGFDDHLRKLETVVYSISGTTDEAVDGTAPGNCYSIEMSTHAKNISIKTSKLNGEHCIYGIQIDTQNGKIQIVDDLDNEIVFDSKETEIRAKNADGTFVTLNKKVIDMYAPDYCHLKAENLIHFETKKYVLDAPEVEINSDTIKIENSDAITINTGTFEMNGQQFDFTAPQSTFNGNLTVTGSFSMGGGGGSGTFKGPVTFEQPITCNGITSSAPIQGPSDTI